MAVPSVTTPQAADQIFDSTPQIQWTEIAGADSYEIWVSQIGNNQGAVYIQPGIAHNRVTLPFHLNDQLHRVWVRAFDANGQSSAWSSPLDFSVVYDKPNFLSASNITQTSASLSWNGVTGADSYEVWLAQNSGRVQLLSNLTSTTTQVTGLSTAATHTFWVRAMNDGHEISSWSPGKTFVTGGTPFATERPTGSNPGTVKNTTSAQLSWNHIPGADHYEVWLNRSDGTNIFIDNQVNSTVYWADQLQPGTSYRYWVRAVDEGGYHSRWSYAQNFSIAASNNELSNTTHVSSGSYDLGTAYSSSPNLVIDANSSVTLQSHNFDPTFDTIVIRAGATVTGQPLVSGDTFTLKANTLILEAGATLTGDFLTLQTTETFIGANATITAPGMYVRGRYVLGDSGNMYATAFASGSAFDPIITNGGVSFADQETTSDADFDDLSDIQEIVAGTLGGSADTDGDWLLDGFEVHNGLDPKTPLGNPSSPSFQWPDDDNDGLHLLDEQIYGTNPNLWDTDGDDRSDFDEANNGSNPNDHTDQGVAVAASDIVHVKLTVGDIGGGQTERYFLKVGDIKHQSTQFGVLSSRVYKFRRGSSHEIQLVHVASSLNEPDYDYVAKVETAAPSTANEIILVDPEDLLPVGGNTDRHNPDFPGGQKRATLIIPDPVFDALVGDIDIAGVADNLEVTEGVFVNVNLDDDDDDGGTPDRNDVDGVTGEDDLVAVTFSISTSEAGDANLAFDSSKIRLWRTINRTSEVIASATDFALNQEFTVYAEGIAEVEDLITLLFVPTTGQTIEIDAVKLIAAESILIAIDGTGSLAWSQDAAYTITLPDGTERTQSHVQNFYDDYASSLKTFQHGPASPFFNVVQDMDRAINSSVAYAESKWRENPNRPIDIIGHSRGGWAAIIASYDLSNLVDGGGEAPCIRFVGLYDAVASMNGAAYRTDIMNQSSPAGNVDENDRNISLPSAVKHSVGVYAAGTSAEMGFSGNVPTELQSRGFFERMYIPDKSWLFGTHSAIGGAPWEGDHPAGHSWQNDKAKAIQADMRIREAAEAAGVPLANVDDYGFDYVDEP